MPKRAALCLICALAFAAFGAAAQETTDAADARQPGDSRKPVHLDTVVVTARRRDEALQQVPLSVTALDALELQSRGAEDLSALGAAVPNLTIYPARAWNGTVTAYIRGVGQADPVWGVDPGVAVYVDDVYLARAQAALLEILDVERIEVLRGPQGTLYGKNTIGGAVKYVTRQIDDEFSGNVGVTVGNYHRRDFKAVVNVPMGERLRTRVAFGSFNRGGFGRNLITGEDVSDKDVIATRVIADWFPGDDVDVRLAYDRYQDRSGVRGAKRLAVNPFDPLRTSPNANNYDVQNDASNMDHIDAEGLSATVDWQPDARWRLKSITAHRKGSSEGHIDFDTLPLPISTLFRRFSDEQSSQEFQFHWSSDRTHAIAGLYYFDGEAGGAGYTSSYRLFAISQGVVETRSAAIYGDLTYDFNDGWSTDLGLRYTSEEKTATVFNQRYTDITFTTPYGAASADFTDSKTFNALSPRINVSYRPNETAMLYAQASRGFKGGTYNIRANTRDVPESALPLEDESVTSYEIGAKTQWLEGRITLNAAVFHNDYRDIQLSIFTSIDSNGDGIKEFFGDFKNAGAGTIRGAEFELSAQTGKHLKWMGHVGYLDPKYDEFISDGVDIADSHFSNAPRWTVGLSAIADIPLPSAGSLIARFDGRYQSKVYPTTDLRATIVQEAYALLNASLAWHMPKKNWLMTLTGQNLTDKKYLTSGFGNLVTTGIQTGFYGPPRTVSLSLTYFF